MYGIFPGKTFSQDELHPEVLGMILEQENVNGIFSLLLTEGFAAELPRTVRPGVPRML